MDERMKKVDSFLQQRLDAYIEETKQLCAQPSVSAKGERMAECAKLAAEILQGHGFRVHRFETPGNPILVGRIEGRSPRTLLFYNHYDVQPPEPLELWTTPPFEPTIRDGALYARGAKDDKGEFIARLAAVDAVRAAYDGELPCGVLFVLEGEEEIGSPHVAKFVREHLDLLKCQGAVWEEGGINASGHPVNGLGRRGVLNVELEVETLTRDAHSGNASVLPNAAWRLLWALASLKGPDERIRISGFYDNLRRPSQSDLQLLAARPSDEKETGADFGVKRFVRGVTGEEYKRAVFEPTCNIQGFGSGYLGAGTKTVIPARAVAKVDFRLLQDQDPDDVFAKLRRHLDKEGFADVTVRRLGAMWPYKISADHSLVSLTSRTGEEVYGKPGIIVPMLGGSSPVYAFAGPLGGIPVVNAGVGYHGSRTHSPDEHVRLTDFVNGARHIARILNGFAEL